jgi:hypothetical protein
VTKARESLHRVIRLLSALDCDSYIFQVTVMATAAVKDIVLEGSEHYHSWFSNIKGSVPEDLWKYFDPETADEYTEPEVVTVATLRPQATSLQQLSTVDRTLYTQLRTIYNNDVSQYQRYLGEKAKLRIKLLNTVPEAKRVLLPADESIRKWISNLQVAILRFCLSIRRPLLMVCRFLGSCFDSANLFLSRGFDQ